jgi:acyl-CoA synthetase (AMP-forming)/AMP-acid ligase II
MILASETKIAEFTERGWWGTRTIYDYFVDNVAKFPDREAVVDAVNRPDFLGGAPRRLTYAQLKKELDRLSALMYARGLRKDAIVAMQLPNCVEQFVLYLACARLGVIITPVPVQYREHELEHVLGHTKACAMFTSSEVVGHDHVGMMLALQASVPTLKTIYAWGAQVPPGADSLQAALPQSWDDAAVSAYVANARITANDVFTICWTSGTEARSKGVPRSHNEWLRTARAVIDPAQLQPGFRFLNPFPLINMAGIGSALFPWAVMAGTVIQHHPFKLPVFLQQLREESVDYTLAPPAVLNMLLQNDALLEGIDFKRLKCIGSGAAPLSTWMVQGFKEKHGVDIVNTFASNEGATLCGSVHDIPDPALRASHFPRIGVAGYEWKLAYTEWVKTRLVDLGTGQDIDEPGQIGELRFYGPAVFPGYFHAPELSERAFDEQGYYRTGDLFEIAGDRKQYYKYVGRSKDLVIRGGMNISAEEIEGLITGYPKVAEVAVVGYPDPILGERLCACIVAKPQQTISLEEIVEYLKSECRIAVYKLPERIELIPALPRNPVGKVLKRELRERLRAEVTA